MESSGHVALRSTFHRKDRCQSHKSFAGLCRCQHFAPPGRELGDGNFQVHRRRDQLDKYDYRHQHNRFMVGRGDQSIQPRDGLRRRWKSRRLGAGGRLSIHRWRRQLVGIGKLSGRHQQRAHHNRRLAQQSQHDLRFVTLAQHRRAVQNVQVDRRGNKLVGYHCRRAVLSGEPGLV